MKKYIFLLFIIFAVVNFSVYGGTTIEDWEYQKSLLEKKKKDSENNNGNGGSTTPSVTNDDFRRPLGMVEGDTDEVVAADGEVPGAEPTQGAVTGAVTGTNNDSASARNTANAGQNKSGNNAKTIKTKKEIAEAKTGGDPVKLSEGSYIQDETDFAFNNIQEFTISRQYSSNNTIISSFGYSWTTNLDERIILGTDAGCEETVAAFKNYVNNLIVRIPQLESTLAQMYHVSDIYNAEEEINERIRKCNENLSELDLLLSRAESLYSSANSYHLSICSSIQSEINRIRELIGSIEAKKQSLEESLDRLPQDLAVISQLRIELSAADAQLRASQNALNRAIQIRNRNSLVMFSGMGKEFEETGFNTLTVIDENGSPHILYETSEGSGIWKGSNEKEIYQCEKNDTGHSVSLFDGKTKYYDAKGFLVNITDRNGNYVLIKRDADEKILSVESYSGEKLTFVYKGKYIEKIINERCSDENTEYSYEGNKLIKVKDTDGDSVELKYDADSRLIALNKCDGSSVQFVYGEQTADKKVLTTCTINEEGFSERFVYNLSTRSTEYIDHDGNKTLYEYDEKYRTKKEIHPDGTVIINTYDANGNLATVNENGRKISYQYDERGNRISAVYDDGSGENWSYDNYGLVTSYRDRDGLLEETLRDDRGNLIEYKKGGKTVFTQKFNPRGQVIQYSSYGQKIFSVFYDYGSYGNLRSEIKGDIHNEYAYDNRNRLLSVRRNGKLIKEYVYYGHKTVEKNYNGLETVYLTDGRKDLIKITQKDTVTDAIHETRIEYDKRHLPLRIYAGDGQTEVILNSYLYTAEGKIKAEISHGNECWIKLYEYLNGQICTVKQFKSDTAIEPSETSSYERQVNNLLLSAGENLFIQKYSYELNNGNRKLFTLIDGLEHKSIFEYDGNGNLIKATDGNKDIKQYIYSAAGYLKGEQTSYGGWYVYTYLDGKLTGAGEQNGVPARTEYYPDGSLKSQTDRYGNIIYYNYDDSGRITCVQNISGKTWYEYDDFDRIKKQVVGNASDENSSLYYVTYDYSDDGRIVTVTEGDKYKTVRELDAFGNVIKQTDGNNNERTFVYDIQNHMTESYDGYGSKTSYEYNAFGKANRITLPDGTETDYEYNYMGLLEKVRDDCGTIYEAVYDKAGRLIKERNRADIEKSYEYDAGGRVTKVLCGGEVVESYSYGPNNRTVTVKDGNGNDYLYNYDGFGRLVNERNRAGLEQNYYYDAEGQLKSQTNFDSSTTTINYSSDRTVRTVNYSDGSQNRFVYDAIGNITEAENAYGKTIYQYDQGGLLIYQKDVTTGEEVRFEYDACGNRTRLYSSNRETKYTYGKNSEVKEIFDNKQRISIKLSYDKNGREVLRKFGNGTEEATLYDKAGRVTVKMQKNERGEFMWGEGYVYGSDGKRTATVDNSGRVTLYEYNKKGQLENVYYPFTQELIKKLKEEAAENGLPDTSETGINKYLTADTRAELILRLNSMKYGLSSNLTNLLVFVKESYAYDKNGNRKTKTTPYGTIEYNYDSENCLISSGSRGHVFINYKYDRMGNLLTEESPNKITKYAYNSQNRLIYCEVTDKSAKQYAQTSYAYDAFGRRIIVQDKGEAALRTLYDGLTFDIIKQSQTNASGLFTDTNMTGIRWGKTGKPTGDRYRYISDDETSDNNRYVYIAESNYRTVSSRYRGERTELSVNGTLAAQTTTDYGTEYFSTDILGSVRTTSDSFGMVKSTVSYDAFGSLIEGNLSQNHDYGYLGKQHDPTSLLYNYGYRDYKSQFSRFTTVDPIRDGSNWFIYCNEDPVNYIDKDGLFYYFGNTQRSNSYQKKTTVYVFRNNDGIGNEFNSTRMIFKDGVCVYVDQVGANCSEDYYDGVKNFTEPDGVYYYTTQGLTNNGDGTFDSENFHNVLRHKTDDPSIPAEIRNAINNTPGDFLDHANQFKDEKSPYNSNQTPGSAGCTIGKGGQNQQDDFIKALMEGVDRPENIKRVVTSANHVKEHEKGD